MYEAEGDNAEAIGALERLYRQTSRFTDLLGIYEKKRDLSSANDEKSAINYEIAKLYENEIKDVDKAIDTYVQVLEDEPADAQALAALDVLYGASGGGSRTSTSFGVESSSTWASASSSTSSTASARPSRSTSATRRARWRTTARSSSSTRSTRVRATRARGDARGRASGGSGAPSSSRSTRSVATGRSSSARSRSSAPARATSRSASR